MDYIFGTARYKAKLYENLKTVGEAHTDLVGFTEIKREYTDCDIVDHFHIVEKVKSDVDSEGRCYDWYIIDQHYRHIDYTKLPKADIEELKLNTAALEDAVCEFDAMNEERIAAIEDALCEIDMMNL